MSAQRDAYSKHGAGSYSLVRVLPDISHRIWREDPGERMGEQKWETSHGQIFGSQAKDGLVVVNVIK